MTALLALLAALVAGPTPDRFVPPTQREAGRVVLPLTFTDGTRAELRYPPRLRLARRGVEPYGSGTLGGRVGRDFDIVHGDVADVMAERDATLRANYGGSAGLWEMPPGEDPLLYLAFQFGRWTVLVYDYPRGAASMTEAERAAWARSMSGREVDGGFLRLDATRPLSLARAGDHAGPQLAFGGMAGPLTLFTGRCRPTRDHDRIVGGTRVSWSRGYATWCLSKRMRADSYASPRRRRALIRSLEVR